MVRMPGPGQYTQSTLLGWQRPEDEPESDVLCSMGRLGVLFTSAIRDIGVGVCASITEKFEGRLSSLLYSPEPFHPFALHLAGQFRHFSLVPCGLWFLLGATLGHA